MELRQEQWEFRTTRGGLRRSARRRNLVKRWGVKLKGRGKEWTGWKERWGSPTEEIDRSGFESLQEKVGRLSRRVEELESDRKKGRDCRQMTGSSSENEGGGGRWKWDGENWWFRVDHRGPINSKLEAEDFQDDIGDYRRDEDMGRRVVSTQVKSGMVEDRKSTAIQDMGR